MPDDDDEIIVLISGSFDERPAVNGSHHAFAALNDCPMCDEPVYRGEPHQAIGTPSGVRYAHLECLLREVVGGIGHLIAHEYWCLERHDTNAGLTPRQSAKLTDAWVRVMGTENLP